MEYVFEIEDLAASARALAKEPEALAARGTVEAGLLALGLEVEQVPELGPEWRAALGEAERLVLLAFAEVLREAELVRVSQALEVGEASLKMLEVYPELSDDPVACEDAQDEVLAGLAARERLHRLDLALGGLGRAPSPVPEGLDEGLKALLLRGVALQPARALRGAELDPALLAAHWWWSLPAAESKAEGSLEVPDAVGRWLHERMSQGRLVLDRDEARALLSTPRGQWLATRLEGRLDVSAGALTAEEREAVWGKPSVGELGGPKGTRGQKRSPFSVLPGGRQGDEGRAAAESAPLYGEARSSPVWMAAEPDVPYRVAAAGGVTLKGLGLGAIVGFVAESAALEAEVGVVACGTCRETGAAAWLLLPAAEVEAVAIEGVAGPARLRSEWGRGGLLWTTNEPSLALRLQVRSGGELEERREEFQRGAPLGQDDALIEVLDLIASGDRLGAAAVFEELRGKVARREVLAGLEAALQEDAWTP